MKSQIDYSSLQKKIKALEKENQLLNTKLNAKRYRLIDAVVDSAYKLVPLNKAQNINIKKQKKPKRSIKRKYRKYNSKSVDIWSYNFFDWDGNVLYKGGAERYIFDLANLLMSQGYKVRILQGANYDFKNEYQGVQVLGIKSKKNHLRTMSRKYNKVSANAEFVIVSQVELASELNGIPAIAINHGINFDGPWSADFSSNSENYSIFFDAIMNLNYCVCVDTNFINWVRTRNYKLSEKLLYIPNYFDSKNYCGKRQNHSHDKLVCVYPRRIYSPRGYDITIDAFKRILRDSKNVEIRFVGQIDNEKVKNDLLAFKNDFPDNVFHYEYEMQDMPKAYSDADIVIIPTKYSEGTSLSCIEGLASGAAVIATNVGGLPNIIIDHHNGLLIPPTAEAIEEAVRELIKNPSLREKLSKNGISVAFDSFQKNNWDERWNKIIDKLLNDIYR